MQQCRCSLHKTFIYAEIIHNAALEEMISFKSISDNKNKNSINYSSTS